MRIGSFLGAAATLCALSAGAAPVGAQVSPLVELLGGSGRPHPLADARGRIPFTVALPDGSDADALGLLEVAPGVGAIRLSPTAAAEFAAAHPGLVLDVAPLRRALLDVSKKWTHADTFRNTTGFTGKGVLVGVVDTGLDARHIDFRHFDGKTRVAWMLTSDKPTGKHPVLEKRYKCSDPAQSSCAIFDAADIDALIADPNSALLRDPDGHGTHVTSIAAGSGGLFQKYVGVAPEATLIVAAPSPPGGGFADADILNSAKFIFDRADALGMPCVVNLSLGGDYGSHDGTSSLEKGLSALVGDDHPGRAIVVAAGNSGALYEGPAGSGPLGIHTEVRVTGAGVTRVPFVSPKSTNGQVYVWVTFRPGDRVAVGLEGPKGSGWIGLVGPGEQAGYKGADKTTGAVVNNLSTSNSQITKDTDSAIVVIDGAWPDQSEFAVLLEGEGDADLWMTSTGDVSPEVSGGVFFDKAIRQGTINVPASAPNLLAVGCTINRDGWDPEVGPPIALTMLAGAPVPPPDSACYFSSAGPTPLGVAKPEINAPGGFVAAAMASDADPRKHPGGIFDGSGCPTSDKCYVVDELHAVAIGTSMSAPHVTGAIALLMEADPTLTQARATDVLQAGARRPTGQVPYDYQMGPGALDLEGARLELAVEMASSVEPDVAQSWYVLSSSYARSDSTWPVWGTIELRRADGTIAAGLSGTALSLVAEGGVVLQPITKVRAGMWRFAIAGAPGMSGRGSVKVDVLYGGVSLGARELPIGTDAWTIDGKIEATSDACVCSAPGGGVPSKGAPILLALGLAGALVRRSRRSSFTRSR